MSKEKNKDNFIGYHITKRKLDDDTILMEMWYDDPNENKDNKSNNWKLFKSVKQKRKDWDKPPSDHRVHGFDF